MAPKKPRLFSFGRETELQNLESWVEDPQQRALLIEVVDSFIEITRTRKLRDETLDPIVRGAGHASDTVRALAITRLVVLSHYFEQARAALGTLATDTDPSVRLFVASSLANAPVETQERYLAVLVGDVDERVRKTAEATLSHLPST